MTPPEYAATRTRAATVGKGMSHSLLLLINTTGQETSVNSHHRTRYVASCLRSQENSCSYEFFWVSEPFHRCSHQQFLSPAAVVQQLRIQRGRNHSRCDRIHTNATTC